MTVGDFSSTITAITNLSNNFLQYSNIIPEFRQHALFIGNYIDVLNIETNIYKKEKNSELKEEIKQIRLNNLYFKFNFFSILSAITGIMNPDPSIAMCLTSLL